MVNPSQIYSVETSSSDASITFTTSIQDVNIMDPEDPTRIHPDFPDKVSTSSLLSLNHVSPFTFGNQPISIHDQIYNSTNTAPFIQITDLRGTKGGWTVTAQMSAFKDENSENSLQGTLFYLYATGVGSPSDPYKTVAPNHPDSIVLTPGGDAELISEAPVNKGVGTWLTTWLGDNGEGINTNVQLHVPASTMSTGTHTSTITWTLLDAPQ